MKHLQWKTVKDKDPFPRPDCYTAEVSAQVDVSEYGETWGSSVVGVRIRFSIYQRMGNSCHAECFPYQLLVNGSQSHIYLRTVDEGKVIAEKICKKLLNQLTGGKHVEISGTMG